MELLSGRFALGMNAGGSVAMRVRGD